MSGNPKELRHARKAANEAAAMLEAIEALPRRRGSRVRWQNGVIWERAGDDQWIAHHSDGTNSTDDNYRGNGTGLYPSAHVASFGFWPIAREEAQR